MHTHRGNWHTHINNAHKCINAWLPSAWQPKNRLTDMQVLCSRVSVVCVCVCLRQWCSLHPAVRMPEHIPGIAYFRLLTCMSFIGPSIFIWGCVETFGQLSQRQGASVHSHTHAMYNPTEQSPTRQCSNAMLELKKTRDKKLWDSQKWWWLRSSWPNSQWKYFQLFSSVDWEAKDRAKAF